MDSLRSNYISIHVIILGQINDMVYQQKAKINITIILNLGEVGRDIYHY